MNTRICPLLRHMLLLAVSFWLPPHVIIAAQGPCDTLAIHLAVDGFDELLVRRPEQLELHFRDLSACVGPDSDVPTFRYLVQLGAAYLVQRKPFDEAAYERLLELALTRGDRYAEGLLRYRATVGSPPPDPAAELAAFQQALDLIQHSDGATSVASGKLHFTVAKYLIRLEGGRAWLPLARQGMAIYAALGMPTKGVDGCNTVLTYLTWVNPDRKAAEAFLPEALAYCAAHDPISMPLLLLAKANYMKQFVGQDSAFHYYGAAADRCIEQKQQGAFCPDCSMVLANGVRIPGLMGGDLARVEHYLAHLPEMIDPHSGDDCLLYLLQADYQTLMGRSEHALVLAREADACYAQRAGPAHGNHTALADTRIMALDRLGDLDAARNEVQEQVSWSLATGARGNAARVWGNWGITLANHERHEEALAVLANDTMPIPHGPESLDALGRSWVGVGRPDNARTCFRQALGMASTAEVKAKLLARLAMLALNADELDRCRSLLDSSLAALQSPFIVVREDLFTRLERTPSNEAMDLALRTRARYHLTRHAGSDERAHLDSCVWLADRAGEVLGDLIVQGLSSRFLQRRFADVAAIRLEAMDRSPTSDPDRATAALRTMAELRARELRLSMLRNEFSQDSTLQAHARLSKELNALYQASQAAELGTSPGEAAPGTARKLLELQRLERVLMGDVMQAGGADELTELTTDRMQRWASETNTALLSLLVTDDRIFTLCITPEGTALESHPVSLDSLAGVVDDVRERLLAREVPQEALTGLLSHWAIPTLLQNTEAGHLVLASDGPFERLPLDLLPVPGAKVLLGERFPVRRVSSVTEVLRTPRPSGSGGVLALAPAYEQPATDTTAHTHGRSRWLFARSANTRALCGPLAWNTSEARHAVEQFGGLAITGREATEEAMARHAAQHGILLLSLHGFDHEVDPALSGLVFADAFTPLPQDTATVFRPEFFQNDGILHAFEIQDMQLPYDLVVLSACHSGTGAYRQGEGVQSLARAFLAAGARSVVMSLWQVDDASTHEIVNTFMDNLAKGMWRSEALSAAKRAYREAHPSAPPYYWSGLVLIGDDGPVVPDRKPVPWIPVLAGLVGIGLLWLALRRRKARLAA